MTLIFATHDLLLSNKGSTVHHGNHSTAFGLFKEMKGSHSNCADSDKGHCLKHGASGERMKGCHH
jgi:hypothetical protein